MRTIRTRPSMRSLSALTLPERNWSVASYVVLMFCLPLLLCRPPFAGAQNAPVPVPAQVRIEQDDTSTILRWNGFPNWGYANPDGVTGYQIRWGLAGTLLTNTTLTATPIVQIQPLVNGTRYEAEIRAVNEFGILSAPTKRIAFTGDNTRVQALRRQMNGFFDDFNLPAGPTDERKWNHAFSRSNDPEKNGIFINAQFHVHSTLATKTTDRGQNVSRPRAPFLIGGRTGTITFDFDGANRRDQWYLDIVPKMMDIHGQVHLLDGIEAYPPNTLRFHQSGNSVAIKWMDQNGVADSLASSGDLHNYDIELTPNVRQHFKLKVSQTKASVYINDKLVCSANIKIPWTQGQILWNAFSYNTAKANEELSLTHWDNFGFDAPANWRNPVETVNYKTAVANGLEALSLTHFTKKEVTIKIPDSLTGATAGRLLFTMQVPVNSTYTWHKDDAVYVNGKKLAVPKPGGISAPPSTIVSAISPYTVLLPLPVSYLKRGDNKIEFAMNASGVLNVHVEADFAPGTTSGFLPPAAINPAVIMPVLPEVGMGVTLSRVNDTVLWPLLNNGVAQAMQNVLDVTGVLQIEVKAQGESAFISTGKHPGLRKIELLMDKVLVQSYRTDTQTPSAGGHYFFTLDTRKWSNGRHELFARGYSATNIPSLPDYFQGYGFSDDYYPLVLNVKN